MAASIVYRCALLSRSRSRTISPLITGKRFILSSAYTSDSAWEKWEKETHNLADLASQMERNYERKLPVSSLSIARFVDNIKSRGEIDQAEYYLYNGVQYGIFPNNFTFNLLLDTFIKKENFEGMAYILLYVWVLEKNLGASLLLAGLGQENTVGYSSQLYGYSLIGKVELSQGLRAVYTQMPLIWKPGYFQRALDVMEKVSQMPGEIKITKDVIDILKSALDSVILSKTEKVQSENDEVLEDASMFPEDSEKTEEEMLPEYLTRFQELHRKLESLGKIETADLLNLTTPLVQEKLPECEKSDIENYEAQLKEWQNDEMEMITRENKLKEKIRKEYEAKQAALSTAQ
uniref:28S ribosomal protein S27, mitochondrial n=1 Tax=Pyxicephalus adspersus TaxID=30357 RepID=A0AAV3AL04_PYXAD|nr:TPA: hypothetical protein GDO54_014366 [Pyxicephalus adspersus]